MGYNTKHFDHEAHYASKSIKELQQYLKKLKSFRKNIRSSNMVGIMNTSICSS